MQRVKQSSNIESILELCTSGLQFFQIQRAKVKEVRTQSYQSFPQASQDTKKYSIRVKRMRSKLEHKSNPGKAAQTLKRKRLAPVCLPTNRAHCPFTHILASPCSLSPSLITIILTAVRLSCDFDFHPSYYQCC